MPDTVPSWPTTTLATSARSRSMAAWGSAGAAGLARGRARRRARGIGHEGSPGLAVGESVGVGELGATGPGRGGRCWAGRGRPRASSTRSSSSRDRVGQRRVVGDRGVDEGRVQTRRGRRRSGRRRSPRPVSGVGARREAEGGGQSTPARTAQRRRGPIPGAGVLEQSADGPGELGSGDHDRRILQHRLAQPTRPVEAVDDEGDEQLEEPEGHAGGQRQPSPESSGGWRPEPSTPAMSTASRVPRSGTASAAKSPALSAWSSASLVNTHGVPTETTLPRPIGLHDHHGGTLGVGEARGALLPGRRSGRRDRRTPAVRSSVEAGRLRGHRSPRDRPIVSQRTDRRSRSWASGVSSEKGSATTSVCPSATHAIDGVDGVSAHQVLEHRWRCRCRRRAGRT